MNYLKPEKLIIFSTLLWFICFLIIPYNYHFDANINKAVTFTSACLLFFLVGTKSVQNPMYNFKGGQVDQIDNFKIKFILIFLIGLFGVLLRIYQRLFLDDITSFDSASEFRLMSLEEEKELSLIQIIAAVCYPFGLVALLLFIYFRSQININKYIIYFSGSLFPLEAIFLGGRLNMAVFAIILLIAFFIKKSISNEKIYFQKKHIFYFLSVFFLFILYSNKIIIDRLELMGFDFFLYISYIESARDMTISQYYYDFLYNSNFSGLGSLSYMLVEIIHYYISGIIEFFRLYLFSDDLTLWYGSFQFNVYLKFLSFFGVDGLPSMADVYSVSHHNPGRYTSFIGPAFIDFGYYAIFYIFLIGLISKKLFYYSSAGFLSGLLLYPFIAMVIILSPMHHFMMGPNLYILNAFLISLIILKTN